MTRTLSVNLLYNFAVAAYGNKVDVSVQFELSLVFFHLQGGLQRATQGIRDQQHTEVLCQKLGKNIYRSDVKVTLSFMVISYAYCSFVPNKTTFSKYCLTKWISKLPESFEIQLSKAHEAVPGKFHGSGGHNKCHCLQD